MFNISSALACFTIRHDTLFILTGCCLAMLHHLLNSSYELLWNSLFNCLLLSFFYIICLIFLPYFFSNILLIASHFSLSFQMCAFCVCKNFIIKQSSSASSSSTIAWFSYSYYHCDYEYLCCLALRVCSCECFWVVICIYSYLHAFWIHSLMNMTCVFLLLFDYQFKRNFCYYHSERSCCKGLLSNIHYSICVHL